MSIAIFMLKSEVALIFNLYEIWIWKGYQN